MSDKSDEKHPYSDYDALRASAHLYWMSKDLSLSPETRRLSLLGHNAIEVLLIENESLRVARKKSQRYLQALYQIIDAWDGNDDSMSSDPAEIARAALQGDE